MTVCMPIGKFETNIKIYTNLGFQSEQKAELDATWISYGRYSIQIKLPNIDRRFEFELIPDWVERVLELYPEATKNKRMESYKPFYEDYDPCRAMFDMGEDLHFQAFKDPLADRIIMLNHIYISGVPKGKVESINIDFEEFKKLSEFLKNSNKFYSFLRFEIPNDKN